MEEEKNPFPLKVVTEWKRTDYRLQNLMREKSCAAILNLFNLANREKKLTTLPLIWFTLQNAEEMQFIILCYIYLSADKAQPVLTTDKAS